MEDLTFGEQVKIILGRKGMTIKELAEIIEERTGKKMSRQNLTQRLGRDNFQEQDMRMIANILGCPFHLSILSKDTKGAVQSALDTKGAVQPTFVSETEEKTAEQSLIPEVQEAEPTLDEPDEVLIEEDAEDVEEVDMTIGELYEIHEELSELEETVKEGESTEVIKEELEKPVEKKRKDKFRTGAIFLRKKNNSASAEDEKPVKQGTTEKIPEIAVPFKAEPVKTEPVRKEAVPEYEDFEPVIKHDDAEEDLEKGDVNPYTGREFQTNSVRMHPNRIGYVQVYDRTTHKWTDMTEWAFLGYQERKKALLGKDYEPPIYLD